MKILIAALLAAQLAAQSPAVDSLLTSSAADFQAHGPKVADARAVRSGLLAGDGKSQLVICGQVLPVGEGKDWLDFSTVKTSGYEQAPGWQATALCAKARIDTAVDLTPVFKAKIGLK